VVGILDLAAMVTVVKHSGLASLPPALKVIVIALGLCSALYHVL
jgi:hypothetical protein